jgi:hypothetical protein
MSVEQISKQDEYGSVRLSKKTIKRLQARGQYKDNFDTIVERLLDRIEGREPEEGGYSW